RHRHAAAPDGQFRRPRRQRLGPGGGPGHRHGHRHHHRPELRDAALPLPGLVRAPARGDHAVVTGTGGGGVLPRAGERGRSGGGGGGGGGGAGGDRPRWPHPSVEREGRLMRKLIAGIALPTALTAVTTTAAVAAPAAGTGSRARSLHGWVLLNDRGPGPTPPG